MIDLWRYRKAAACVLALLILTTGEARRAAGAGPLVAGRFGGGLDATQGTAQIPANRIFSKPPITVECWARIDAKDRYNIIVASEAKASPTHWELFTMHPSGYFCAYLPGRKPDHARTTIDITDGRWHALAMIMEPARVRLYVDGALRADVATTPAPERGEPGALTIGALSGGGLGCAGRIDEVRISRGVRALDALPAAPYAADAATVALWHFDEQAGLEAANAAKGGAAARISPANATGQGLGYTPMSAAFQALPKPADAAPLREGLTAIAARLGLQTIAAQDVRDAVLRQWDYDFTWHGKFEYPLRGRSVFYQDAEAVKREVFDRQALVWETDGGPLGTVLRRTSALVAHFEKSGVKTPIAPAAADLERLKAYCAEHPMQPDEAQTKACYLAACALRRQIALANPLLDFDSILCVARGSFAGSARSNPVTVDAQGGHFATQYFGFNALPGGGVFQIKNFKTQPQAVDLVRGAVVESGRLKGKKLDGGAFSTPDLSFDGKTIAFAWTANREHLWDFSEEKCWHLFTIGADGTHLRQLSEGPFDDFDPCWLPSGRIAFISERRGGYIRCFAAYLKVRNYTLFSMKPDGSDIIPLSYYETSEWNPTVNNEGKILYTRWDYTDRANCLGTRLWICGPDGSDPRAPHGNYPLPFDTFQGHTPWKIWNGQEWDSRLGTPMVEMGVRAIPGSPRYIFTAAPHHGEVFGALCMMDLRQPDDGHMAQVRRITPDEPFPESEQQARRHYKYGTPWPLSEDFYLCNVWENLCLLDRFGNMELLCELAALPCPADERLRLIDPIPLRARPAPPIIPEKTRQGENAGKTATTATLAVVNVYQSDLPLPAGVRIKWLRVTQNILKTNHPMGEPMIGYERENTPRIPLGIVPVEDDGSAYFEAPVAKELIFQALDEHYRAVQSMRSVAYVHPGEQLTCQGCHEPREKAPAYNRTPLAMRRAPSRLVPELGRIEPIFYHRQIKPIFEKSCVPCHTERGKGPRDMSYEAMKNDAFWFAGAMGWDGTRAYSGEHGGSRTIPGRFGALGCRLGRALVDKTHRDAINEADRHAITLWLDSNSLRLGAYERQEEQLRGTLVWPSLDVDPENLVGIPGRGRPLRGNFWHENVIK